MALLSGSVIAQLATVAALPFLARMYSPIAFGEYAIFVSITAFASVIATLRYEMAIVLPRSPREAAAVKQLTLRLLLIASLLIALVCVVIAALPIAIDGDWRWLILLLGPSTFLLGYNAIMMYWFMRLNRYGILSRNRVLQAVAIAGSQALAGLVPNPSGFGLVLGMITGQAVAALLLVLSDPSRRLKKDGRNLRQWSYLFRRHWRLPALTAPQALVDSFRMNGINLVIGSMSLSALGQYSQAWRLVNVPASLIGAALSQVYFPEFASTPRKDLFRAVRSSVVKSMLISAIPFALIFWLSPLVFPWALGDQWVEAGRYAQVLVPWLYINLATSPISTLFVVLQKQHVSLPFAVVYAIAPIVAIVAFHQEMYVAILAMSLTQTVLLLVNLGLAFWIAHRAGISD
ncbi:oligosaccharide flippase family protein [Agrococcus beijingensis]|uniref:oligosaccharide flippase family protein n=1 Tax=Agrococcus beijingensis TaxID=3068634 RepID=UPI00274085F8|nr:oligosaccharide flippase family protein [Agrococcus sp. REN33]